MPLGNLGNFNTLVQQSLGGLPAVTVESSTTLSPQKVAVSGNVQLTGVLLIILVFGTFMLAKNWPI